MENKSDLEGYFDAGVEGIESPDVNYNIASTHLMPVMVLKEEWDEWLDPENHNTNALKELLNSFPDDAIELCTKLEKR